MSVARLLAPWVDEVDRSAIYHCVSRIVGREFLLGREEKEQFVRYMRLYEAFCGVRVLTYCVMSNHFHILVEVPPHAAQELDDEALLDRLRVLYSDEEVALIAEQLEVLGRSTTEPGRLAYGQLRESFTKRMWNLGLFMKTVKQRFSSWYNKRHGRRGTLWEARYKSSLVQDGQAALTVAAYIDLNPLRAGMVSDPRQYRWCGYTEALVGGQLARNGLMRVIDKLDGESMVGDGWQDVASELKSYDWRTVHGRYRTILLEDGEERVAAQGGKARRGFSGDRQSAAVETHTGELSIAAVARCKSRYFVEGAVLGSKRWVNAVIDGIKGDYLSKRRKSGGCRPRGPLKKSGLWSLRQLEES